MGRILQGDERRLLLSRVSSLRAPRPDILRIATAVRRWAGYATIARFAPPHTYGKRRPFALPAVEGPFEAVPGFLKRIPPLPGHSKPVSRTLAELRPPPPLVGEDIERWHSLHRWGWMIGALDNVLAEPEIPLYASTWAADFSGKPEDAAWESYSLSERIANICVLAAIHNGLRDAASLETALLQWAHLLDRRLECYGQRTNNHVLNNARALYLLGAFADLVYYRTLARALLAEWLAVLVPGGCLREGSSHYHLLVLRWLNDVLWAARSCADRETIATVEPIVSAMRDVGRLLVTEPGACVRVGDVSPDITPRALRDFTTRAYGDEAWPDPPAIGLHHRGEWWRWQSDDAVIVWRLPSSPTPPHPTHAHADLTSFTLTVHGEPVVIDSGRYDYTRSPQGMFGTTAVAHSVLLLDGFGPVAAAIGAIDARAIHRTSLEVHSDGAPHGARLVIRHNGFARVARDVHHERSFDVQPGSVRIVDRLDGRGAHSVSLVFPLGPDFVVSNSAGLSWVLGHANGVSVTLDIELPDAVVATVTALAGQDVPVVSGWDCPAYGSREPSTTLALQFPVTLPLVVTSTFRWAHSCAA